MVGKTHRISGGKRVRLSLSGLFQRVQTDPLRLLFLTNGLSLSLNPFRVRPSGEPSEEVI